MTARDKQTLLDYFANGGRATNQQSDREQEFEDLIDSLGGGTTLTVAANDASDASKAKADYVCDGTADDVQINAAITALSTTGGKVVLSEGTFSLDVTISAKTKVSIEGQGFGTILQVSSGTNAHGIYSYNAIDFYIANLAIDVSLSGSGAAGGGSTPCGIYVGHATSDIDCNITIRNCYIKGADEVGIITLGVHTIQILDNVIEDCTYSGIHTDDQENVLIRGNTVRNCTSYGIRITNNTDYSTVTDNIIEGCAGANTSSLSVLDSNYNSVVGNTVWDSSTANSVGIDLAISTTSACDYNTVIGNTVIMDTSVYSGIQVSAAANNVVSGNNVSGSAAYGIQETGAGADSNLISNNTLEGSTAGVASVGSSTIVRDNFGYVTENSGTSNIASGGTTKTVAHGCATTPTVVNIAFREQGTNDYGRWWLSGIGSTGFTLNVSGDPGASNLDFAWEAKVR